MNMLSAMRVLRAGRARIPLRAGFVGLAVALSLACATVAATGAVQPTPIKIAVFDFELDDASPAAAFLGQSTSSAALMAKVSSAAREELEHSGRYRVIDASQLDPKLLGERSLKNCAGCEAGIALRLGAEQSLIGVVRRVTQTDYYVTVLIRDARSGKIVDQQEANFAGGEEGWASGVRMLIRHQILANPE